MTTTWISVAKAADLPPGQRKCVDAQGSHVVLYNNAGEVLAFENECPHAGMPLAEGSISGTIIVCPFHGYTFDLKSGKNVDYADDIPVKTYAVRTENDDIQVKIAEDE